MKPSPANFQSTRTVVLSMLIGSAGLLVLGIQPLLLGGLLHAGAIDAPELGWIATAEVLSMAAGLLVGTRGFALPRGRSIAVAACLLMALANLATMAADAVTTILLARLTAGLAEGMMIAVTVLTISYGRAPGRLSAIFLTASALPQLVGAYTLPAVVFPVFGIESGFVLLAIAGLLSAVSAALIRDRLAPEPQEKQGSIAWTPKVVQTLTACLVSAAAIGACWSYAEPVALERGLKPEEIGLAIAVSLAFQLIGSLAVALGGYRLRPRVVLPLGNMLQAASIGIIVTFPGFAVFLGGMAVFGFFWQACVAFATDLIVEADASRLTAPLIMPLSLAGLSAGPMFASAFVSRTVLGAFSLGIVGFVLATALYLVIFSRDQAKAVRSGV